MKFLKIFILASLGVLLEYWAWDTLVADRVGVQSSLANVLLYHGLGSAFFSGFLFLQLPRQYTHQLSQTLVVLMAFCFFLPVLGLIGIMVGLILPLYFPKKLEDVFWEVISEPELPLRAASFNHQTTFGVGGVTDVLKNSKDQERRLNAVRAVRDLPGQVIVPVLQSALTDTSDDVRLLAYGMLDNRETRINERIATSLEQLSDANREEGGELHQLIAMAYWELTYIGLAKGGVLDSILTNAWRHAVEAIKINNHPQMQLLLGRISLTMGDHANAAYFLNAAELSGLPADELYAYYAEAAYLRADYDVAAAYGQRLGGSGKQMGRLNDAIALWQ